MLNKTLTIHNASSAFKAGSVLLGMILTGCAEDKTAQPDETAIKEPKETAQVTDTIAPEQQTAAPPVSVSPPQPYTETVRIRRGANLMDTLKRQGIERKQAYEAIEALKAEFNPRDLRAGQRITLTFAPDDPEKPKQLIGLSIPNGFEQYATVTLDASGFIAQTITDPTIDVVHKASGTITDSLFLSAKNAGVPNAVIVNMINLFSFDVDFQREIRKGDSFSVYFKRRISEDGERVQEGDILFTSMTLSGKVNNLYRYTPADDKRADYFNEKGVTGRKTLMKTPVDGARLSSGFGLRRHPILGYNKMHKGTDFAAPTGTPVKASGDGTIEMIKRNGGYGKYIRIRHNSRYKTAYAHLHGYARGLRKGSKVKQGQVIGYVGSTGRSTGPHLHYEVIVNGKQVNPMRLKLSPGRKLKGEPLEAFKVHAASIDSQMAALDAARTSSRSTDLVQNEKGPATAKPSS